VLSPYYDDIDVVEARLALKGKTLSEANKEQIAWLVHYDQRRVELKAIVKFLQLRVDQVRGRLTHKFVENYSRELSERTREKYIDKEDEFLDINEKLLEVDELYDKYNAIVEAFKARGYALRNQVEINVHQLSDIPL
jgi:hypothetical protein